jgi:hypothetical protein
MPIANWTDGDETCGMIAEWEKKRCEPEGPPAALESCAKHTAGGTARRQ